MRLFKNNWSKYIPITIFTHSFEDYLVLGKKNNKTGLIKFKSVKISGKKQHHSSYCLFDKPLNSNEQLLKLCEL
jgi:hypothetical protein